MGVTGARLDWLVAAWRVIGKDDGCVERWVAGGWVGGEGVWVGDLVGVVVAGCAVRTVFRKNVAKKTQKQKIKKIPKN